MYQLETCDPVDWDHELGGFPERTVFHTSPWLRSVARTYKLEMALYRVVSGDSCVALLPYFTTRKGPFRVFGSPFPGTSTPYLGPLLSPTGDAASALAALLRTSPLRRASYFFCRVQDERQPVNLQPYGFRAVRRFETFILDLDKTEEALWAGLDSKCRNLVRRAEKSAVEIRAEMNSDFVDDFWDMSKEVFAKSGLVPSWTRDFTLDMFKSLIECNRLVVLSAFVQGTRIATSLFPHDDRTMYYWAGASRREYLSMSPNNLVLWRAIQTARQLNLPKFDFVSAGGRPGKFKQSFGPERVAVSTHWEYSGSRLVDTAKRVYEHFAHRRRTATV